MSSEEGTPGYCDCCGGFHLLKPRRVRTLGVDLCRWCGARSDGELAWQFGRITGTGAGYGEPVVAPVAGRWRPWVGRRNQAVLAESLILGGHHEAEFAGFGPGRYSLGQRVLMAWWRVRGRL